MTEQKTEVPGIYKVKEGVLINKDTDALTAYKTRKLRERRLETIEDEVKSMKNDLEEIKNLLKGLVK